MSSPATRRLKPGPRAGWQAGMPMGTGRRHSPRIRRSHRSVRGELFRSSRSDDPHRFSRPTAAILLIRDPCVTRKGDLLVASVNGVYRIKDGEVE